MFNYCFYFFSTLFVLEYIRLSHYLNVIYLEIQKKSSLNVLTEYDWIIVGSGTAGSLIANGIESDDVIIIEAGLEPNKLLDIPLLSPLIQRTGASWGYLTEPQVNACLALKEHRSAWPMGRVKGGSSMLNNMIHNRGHPDDFKEWFTNDTSYDYEKDIEPYFIACEKYLNIVEASYTTKLGEHLLQSAQEFGYTNEFMPPKLTQKDGMRWTISHKTKNTKHTILLNALVSRILFNEENNRATGVEYIDYEITRTIKARKGVIVSAGTIGTSKLLLLSGIGPAEDLELLNIPVVKSLPVGRNLQDHVASGLDLVLISEDIGMSPRDIVSMTSLLNFFYYKNGNSPLSHCGCELLGFINTNNRENEAPDLGYMAILAGVSSDYGVIFNEIININNATWNEYFAPLIGEQVVSIMPIVLHPKSNGWVKLSSSNAFDNPIIQPNYLQHHDDVKVLVKGLKILEQLLTMPSMREIGAELNPKKFPNCESFQFGADDYWECYVRHLTLTVYHPVGTCKMGAEDDPTTVVSSSTFLVHSMKNLYVVDASLMPNLPSGNPNAVVNMLAMKFLTKIYYNNAI